MTEMTPEQDESWDDAVPAAPGGATYPEYPYSLADHVYTWSPKLPDGSMLVIRSQTAEGLAEAAEAVSAVAGRLMAAWQNVSGARQQAPAQGGWQTPQTPPPFGQNVSVPGAPGYAGPPVQQAPQWASQSGQFGGGQQGGDSRGPKPRPDWPTVYRITVPYGAKDAFKAFREQNAQVLRGKVAWAGKGDYWVHGDVAQGFAQYNPVAA